MSPRSSRPLACTTVALALAAATASAGELLYVSEGNRLRRIDVDTLDDGPLLEEIVFENAELDPENGRDINGMVCPLPDGSGRFIAGEDTDQPHPPAGWGVLTPDGRQVGKLTATAFAEVPDPHGCAFDAQGRLFTTETGRQFFGEPNGQLIVWFPPFDHFPGPPGAYPDTDATSANYCKIATDIGTAAGVAVDPEGRVYVAAASGMEVIRFWPPFPTSADAEGGCGATDALGSPLAGLVKRERFLEAIPEIGMLTYSGLAMAPNGNLYVASVATGRIVEFDLDGRPLRYIVEPTDLLPPFETGAPQGLAVGSDGTLYYADLDLEFGLSGIEPGPDGKVRRVTFDERGHPRPPEIIARGLAFPDGLGILPGDLEERAARGELRAPPSGPASAEEEAAPEPTEDPGLVVMGLVLIIGLAFLLRRRMERRERARR